MVKQLFTFFYGDSIIQVQIMFTSQCAKWRQDLRIVFPWTLPDCHFVKELASSTLFCSIRSIPCSLQVGVVKFRLNSLIQIIRQAFRIQEDNFTNFTRKERRVAR